MARDSNSAWRALDRAGTFLSAACALHCALIPLALALIPSMTLALLSWHDPRHRMAMGLLQASRWEWLFVLVALLVGAGSLGFGYLRHRSARPGLLLAAAAVSFALAIASPLSANALLHASFAVLAGLALAGGHLLNLRLLHRSTAARASRSPLS